MTQKKNTVRVGLVGAGFAGRFHFECLRRVYGLSVDVVGVTSARAESRDRFATERGIRAFPDAEALLDHVDVLDVCSPPYAHESAILAAVAAGKSVICEKPLTGCFGPPGGETDFHGNRAPKGPMLEEAVARLRRIAEAVRASRGTFGYAENFVYAPSVQKEREILTRTGAQILRMTGEESHNGSASPVYGIWSRAGGGSLMGKGCHPLSGMLYLKRVEGLARDGRPIRPARVTARTHEITRLPAYRDEGLIRTDYRDIEDFGWMHVVFDDGTVCDAVTCEIVLGGIYDYIEVFANNHRTRCGISPAGIMDVYNPRNDAFKDVYLIEKISTKEGWTPAATDENFTLGYQAEIQDFLTCAAHGGEPQSGLDLALDTTAAIYAAYLSEERNGAEVAIPRL